MNINRKKLIIIVSALCAFAVLGGLVLLFDSSKKTKTPNDIELPQMNFYTPDYEINILEDPEYLELNRIISYRNGAVTTTVAPEEYLATDAVLAFLAKLTDTLIAGDHQKYPEYFTEKYLSENEIPEKFTMQRLYNITVEKIGEETDEQGNAQFLYMLDFMISKNDGTFRRDIDSDASRPWYLAIKKINGEYKIDSILTYSQQ